MPARKTDSVPAVNRAISLLELLADSRGGLTLGQLVERTRLPKSSVHALLVTLERRGYLHRSEKTSRYMFGTRLFSLANTALNGLQLREQAGPLLKQLAQETGLATHMGIFENSQAVLVAKYERPRLLRIATWIGKRIDVHCTSLGKALICYLPEAELQRIIKEQGLRPHTQKSIVSAPGLKRELAKTAKRGYAVDDEEDEAGLRCIGASVFNYANEVIAAISLSGTVVEVHRGNIPKLAKHIKQTAAAIGEVLGHRPSH